MAEYEFTVTICGTVVAYSEEDARMLLQLEPQRWGDVMIDDLERVPDDWYDDDTVEE